jgi:hypothetical protein
MIAYAKPGGGAMFVLSAEMCLSSRASLEGLVFCSSVRNVLPGFLVEGRPDPALLLCSRRLPRAARMEAVIWSAFMTPGTSTCSGSTVGRCVHANPKHSRGPCSELNAAQTFCLFPAVVMHRPLACAYRMVSSVRAALAHIYWAWLTAVSLSRDAGLFSRQRDAHRYEHDVLSLFGV